MTIFDLFSKRQKRLHGQVPEVYVYDQLPQPLRVRIVHIIRDALGTTAEHGQHSTGYKYYKGIVEILRREYGTFSLIKDTRPGGNYEAELLNFFLKTPEAECALDVVELAMKVAEEFETSGHPPQPSPRARRAIEELNGRFQESSVGYRFEAGKLIRVDSDLLHAEAVKPALTLMHAGGYDGPLKEFLAAHEHHRHARHESAIVEALKAFESTMKTICDRKGWEYKSNATASKLIDVCLANGLIDPFWQSQLSGLRATLEGGIPTARNKAGGHGQGALPRNVPEELVGYVMHLTASTIVFMIRAAESSDAG